MKKNIITSSLIILATLLTSQLSKAEILNCIISVNKKVSFDKLIEIKSGATFQFDDINIYRIRIHNLGNSKFEIESYDSEAPSRTYSDAFLRSSQDELNWIIWSREVLLETNCRMVQK